MQQIIEKLNIELEGEELTQKHRGQIRNIDTIIDDILNEGEYGGCIELLNNELEHIKIDVFYDDYDDVNVGLIKYKNRMLMFDPDYWIRLLLTHLISVYGFLIANY